MYKHLLSPFEVQQEELRIVKAFDEFAKNRGLDYTLLYGTLLGAVRHQGFIPWDDDIDVGMPRPDYQWLIAHRTEIEAETGFSLVSLKGLPWSCTLMCKLVNKEICVEERGSTSVEHLWIDIFPIDSVPDDVKQAKRICRRIRNLTLLFVALTSPASSAATIQRRIVKTLLKPFGLITNPIALAKEINALAQSTQYGSTEYVCDLTWASSVYTGRIPIRQFSGAKRLPFEGLLLPVMDDPDAYLTDVYGTYMSIPKEGERVAHSIKAWRV